MVHVVRGEIGKNIGIYLDLPFEAFEGGTCTPEPTVVSKGSFCSLLIVSTCFFIEVSTGLQ